jgi:hypothetical protein
VSSAHDGLEAQKASNRSALAHAASFAGHRQRLTAVVSAGAEPGQRLCVLGAGNCYDLDLERLASVFGAIHLVDVDADAIHGARERESASVRERIVGHAPIDLSGLVERLDRWKEMRVTPDEVMNLPGEVAGKIAEALPGPFDVVLSACVLTQLQLFVLDVLTAEHRLFEAVRQMVNLAHLRTLARLVAPMGHAILATDLVSSKTYPLDAVAAETDPAALMTELLAGNHAIYAAHPSLIAWMCREDPVLSRTVQLAPPRDVWLWHNGPELVFLVYAMLMTRRA